MTDKLNMALDDVIKMNKKSKNSDKTPKSLTKRKPMKKFTRPFNSNDHKPKDKSNPTTYNNKKGFSTQNKFIRRTSKYKNKNNVKNNNNTTSSSSSFNTNTNTANGMKNKTMLRISNLDFNITHKDLMDLFSQFGPIIKNRIDFDDLGRSKGTATIQYEKHEAAAKAISEYDGATLDGKQLIVEYVKINKNHSDSYDDNTNSRRNNNNNNHHIPGIRRKIIKKIKNNREFFGGKKNFKQRRRSRNSFKKVATGGEEEGRYQGLKKDN